MEAKVAIVTGASSGIGLAVTLELLEHGYRVVATSRHATASGALVASPRLTIIDGDVGEVGTAERVTREAQRRYGHLDLLVNSAGTFVVKPFTEYTSDDYARFLATNLGGFFHMTQHALRIMVPAGAGHVVNLGTSLASQPVANVPSALPILVKGGIAAATRSLAIEYADRGIRVNTIAPGIVDTPMHPPENHEFLKGLSPAHRIATTAEIAQAVVFLDAATFISGEVLHLDGGAHAGKWS